ncbi:hypothetical protein RUND412_006220 [Rhizina undulata]
MAQQNLPLNAEQAFNVPPTLEQLNSTVMELSNRLQAVESQLQTLQEFLYNVSRDQYSPIRYPPALDPQVPRPKHRAELWEYSVPNCQALILGLGLTPLPPGSSEVAYRRCIADYLGVPIGI